MKTTDLNVDNSNKNCIEIFDDFCCKFMNILIIILEKIVLPIKFILKYPLSNFERQYSFMLIINFFILAIPFILQILIFKQSKDIFSNYDNDKYFVIIFTISFIFLFINYYISFFIYDLYNTHRLAKQKKFVDLKSFFRFIYYYLFKENKFGYLILFCFLELVSLSILLGFYNSKHISTYQINFQTKNELNQTLANLTSENINNRRFLIENINYLNPNISNSNSEIDFASLNYIQSINTNEFDFNKYFNFDGINSINFTDFNNSLINLIEKENLDISRMYISQRNLNLKENQINAILDTVLKYSLISNIFILSLHFFIYILMFLVLMCKANNSFLISIICSCCNKKNNFNNLQTFSVNAHTIITTSRHEVDKNENKIDLKSKSKEDKKDINKKDEDNKQISETNCNKENVLSERQNRDQKDNIERINTNVIFNKKINDNYDKKLYFAEKLISMFEFLKLLDYEKDIECDNFILKDI